MSKIPLHLLEAFVVFNDSKNISDAAKKLSITQPALSKQLQQLERQVAAPLFSMVGRKKHLTHFGKHLDQSLKDRISGLTDIVVHCEKLFLQPENLHLKIAARRGLLDRFSEHLRFIGSVTFLESSNSQTIDQLLNQKIEIGIIHSPPISSELIAKPLFKEKFQIVIPNKYKISKKHFGKSLLDELKNFPCLAYSENDDLLQHIYRDSKIDISNLKIARTTADYSSLSRMVHHHLGWSLLPDYFDFAAKEFCLINVPQNNVDTREFYIAYRKELASSPWFLETIKEIKSHF